MKYLFLFLLLITLSTMHVKGQDDQSVDFLMLNPEISGNITQYPNRNDNMKLGYSIGANLRIGSRLYIQGGAFLLKQAINAKIDTSSQTGVFQDIRAYYAQFPILVGFKVINDGDANLRVFGGVVPNIFLGGEVKNSSISESDFNNSIQALRAGIGMDFFMLSFNFYYDWGVTDIYKTPKDITYRTVSLALGIRLY